MHPAIPKSEQHILVFIQLLWQPLCPKNIRPTEPIMCICDISLCNRASISKVSIKLPASGAKFWATTMHSVLLFSSKENIMKVSQT